MEIIVSSILSVRGLSVDAEADLRRRFTFTPQKPPGTPRHVRPVPVRLCARFKDFVNVPRDLRLLAEMADWASAQIRDVQPSPKSTTKCRFHAVLDADRNQPQAVAACVAQLQASRHGGGCLLSLPPGFGKTACALCISSRIATRTLILVHTRVLAEQWQSRVATFLTDAKAVVLTTSQRTPEDLRAATHVIALLQTVLALAKRRDLAWLDDLHDLVIFDECHHVCASTLCRVVETVGGRYRLGLSATIQRKDGLDTMLDVLIGPVAYACERRERPNVRVRVVRYRSPAPIRDVATFVEHVNDLAKDPGRLRVVADQVHALHEQGRCIIVLSDRLAHLDDLRASLRVPVHMAIGGSVQQPDMALRPVVLATYAFASEGLDIAALNACVLASPRVDVRQSVGRILRSPGGHPVVVDIVDEDRAIMRRQFAKRKKFYTDGLATGGLAATIVDEEVGDGAPSLKRYLQS